MSNFSNIRNKRKKELLNEFKQIYTLSKIKNQVKNMIYFTDLYRNLRMTIA